MDVKQIEKIMRMHDIKPSHHRIKIYQYLVKNKNHPTVEKIYSDLIKEIPTLSKTTIYNTLNLFVEKHIVQLITIEENETRYDADISLHGHFKCKNCGEVYDINLSFTEDDFKELEEFIVDEYHVYFKGTCPNCH